MNVVANGELKVLPSLAELHAVHHLEGLSQAPVVWFKYAQITYLR
jgi:hypothetical protein